MIKHAVNYDVANSIFIYNQMSYCILLIIKIIVQSVLGRLIKKINDMLVISFSSIL